MAPKTKSRRPKKIASRVACSKGWLKNKTVRRPPPGTKPCIICKNNDDDGEDDALWTKIACVKDYGKYNTEEYKAWVGGRVCVRTKCFVRGYTAEVQVRAQSRCTRAHTAYPFTLQAHSERTHSPRGCVITLHDARCMLRVIDHASTASRDHSRSAYDRVITHAARMQWCVHRRSRPPRPREKPNRW